MDRTAKRSFDQMEQSSVAEYVYSASELQMLKNLTRERPPFYHKRANEKLDMNTKAAALKASTSIVSLISFSGEEVIVQGSGTIIETEENNNTVITSLNLIRHPTKEEFIANYLADNLKIVVSTYDNSYIGEVYAFDFHYNLLIVKFKSKEPLQPAKIRMMSDDDVSLDTSFQFKPHSSKIKHGDPVIVLGRYFYRPFNFMAAPGLLSVVHHFPHLYGCKELLSTSCEITRCGDGGPFINLSGEVVGIAYYELRKSSPFLPIDIACKWWDHYKKYKELRHPSYGFDPIDLYLAPVHTLARVITDFPSVSNGVLVEEVVSGSNAELAGLREGDVIIKCDGKTVKSFLEFWGLIWDKVGNNVALQIARVEDCTVLNLDMVVDEATPNELNRWPQYNYC